MVCVRHRQGGHRRPHQPLILDRVHVKQGKWQWPTQWKWEREPRGEGAKRWEMGIYPYGGPISAEFTAPPLIPTGVHSRAKIVRCGSDHPFFSPRVVRIFR